MRIAVIFQSSYGHNLAVSEHLAQRLEERGHEVTIFDVKKSSPAEMVDFDLFIFSSPTHLGRAPRRMRAFLRGVVEEQAGKPYGLVCTKLPSKEEGMENMRTIESMQDILRGDMNFLESLSLDTLKIKGPLREGFEQKLDDFLVALFENL